MHTATAIAQAGSTHYLTFGSLFHSVRSLSFPCDSEGQVELDSLSERARDNYFFARSVVGRDFTVPVVVPAFDAG